MMFLWVGIADNKLFKCGQGAVNSLLAENGWESAILAKSRLIFSFVARPHSHGSIDIALIIQLQSKSA